MFSTFKIQSTFGGPAVPTSLEYLVVAGGGGGGETYNSYYSAGCAGGGGGGYRTGTFIPSAGTLYAVTVGIGGIGQGTFDLPNRALATNGGNSVFNTISASGGGAGAGANKNNGNSGGSGGGGGGGAENPEGNRVRVNAGTGGSGNVGGYNPVEGYAGGAGLTNKSTYFNAGGGGGAGGIGGNASTSSGGLGGAGLPNSITGISVTYASGGRGNQRSGPQYGMNPNIGGGGNGGAFTDGMYGTDGIVVIAYSNAFPNLSNITAGLIYTLDTTTRAGYKVYTFTGGTGTISW